MHGGGKLMIRQALHQRNSQKACLLLILAIIFSKITFAADTQPVQHLFDLTFTDKDSLILPSDVAVAPDGRIYIVDGGNHRIVVYRKNGDFAAILGNKGSGAGQFYKPLGITVDKKGRIYVADTGNHRVQVFDQAGQFIKQIPIRDKNEKIKPVDVATSNSMNTLYVTGNNNHKIMLYNEQGKKIGQWGKMGNNPSEFRYPATITVGKDGAVYVVDVLNSRVQIFEVNGKLRTTVGSWGVLPGNLFRPKGIALDKNDRIYVTDSYMDVIEVFDNKTNFLYVLSNDNQINIFVSPAGVTIDKSNRIYIAEMLENKVSVYLLE